MAITLPANISTQLSKNVDMSNVLNAARQSPGFSGANNSGYTQSNQNPTSLYNAGQQSQMGKNFANYGAQNGQINVPPPPSSGGNNNQGGAFGMGGGENNRYNQNQLPQELFNAGSGSGGTIVYNGTLYRVLNNGDGTRTLINLGTPKPPAPPPPPPLAQFEVRLPGATSQPKPATGATAPLAGLSNKTGGGAMGLPSAALTQSGQATKGLQLPGLAQSVISALSSLVPGLGASRDIAQSIGTFMPQFSQSAPVAGASTPQTQKSTFTPTYQPKKDNSSAVDPLTNMYNWAMSQPASSPARGLVDSIGPAMQMAGLLAGGKGIVGGIKDVAEDVAKGGFKGLTSGLGNILAGTAIVGGVAPGEYMTGAKAMYNPSKAGTKEALTTPQGQPTNMATMQNLMGNVAPQQGIKDYLSGKTNLTDTASSIANPQAQTEISKAINQAMKSGDMGTVGRLADLSTAVTQQLNFINRIGQVVTALSAGLGTPQAQSVTEARTPMVQQGIGQMLTSPLTSQGMTPYQVGSEAQYLQPTIQYLSPQTQQNRPVLGSFMG